MIRSTDFVHTVTYYIKRYAELRTGNTHIGIHTPGHTCDSLSLPPVRFHDNRCPESYMVTHSCPSPLCPSFCSTTFPFPLSPILSPSSLLSILISLSLSPFLPPLSLSMQGFQPLCWTMTSSARKNMNENATCAEKASCFCLDNKP